MVSLPPFGGMLIEVFTGPNRSRMIVAGTLFTTVREQSLLPLDGEVGFEAIGTVAVGKTGVGGMSWVTGIWSIEKV